MRRLFLARRVLLTATAGSVVVLPVVLASPAAWAERPNPSACSGLYRGSPPGSLAITTSPSNATPLRPGDEVEVTATWDTAGWPRPVLHKVLDCLLVDGEIDYEHSSQEKPTDNDGFYRYTFTVPGNARDKVCDRVRLSGKLVDGGPLVVQKSNTICFTMADDAGGSGGPVGPGTPTSEVSTQAVTPAEGGAPAPDQPLAPAAEAPVADLGAPAPPLELSPISLPMLPRTGADPFPLVRVGAMLILLGGVAFAARMVVPRPIPVS